MIAGAHGVNCVGLHVAASAPGIAASTAANATRRKRTRAALAATMLASWVKQPIDRVSFCMIPN
jgi:hypothetical protein